MALLKLNGKINFSKNNFRVSTARFANVAFSNGSLLDGFIYRLKKKQRCLVPLILKGFL